MTPDLNVDLGEWPDEPTALYRLAHRVNVACGGHAGDAQTMRQALRFARDAGAEAGAHPSYPDRANFGRVTLNLSPEEVAEAVRAQCRELHEIALQEGISLHHAKPHGALYHDANRSPGLAKAVVDAVRKALGNVAIVGPPEGALAAAARDAGLPFLREGFADRRYLADGSLAPRTAPDALLTDPSRAAAQARALAASGRFDTLCVHADTPGALAVARAVRDALDGR